MWQKDPGTSWFELFLTLPVRLEGSILEPLPCLDSVRCDTDLEHRQAACLHLPSPGKTFPVCQVLRLRRFDHKFIREQTDAFELRPVGKTTKQMVCGSLCAPRRLVMI